MIYRFAPVDDIISSLRKEWRDASFVKEDMSKGFKPANQQTIGAIFGELDFFAALIDVLREDIENKTYHNLRR